MRLRYSVGPFGAVEQVCSAGGHEEQQDPEDYLVVYRIAPEVANGGGRLSALGRGESGTRGNVL